MTVRGVFDAVHSDG